MTNKFNNPRVADTYSTQVKPTFSHQINEEHVDFTKILEAITFHIGSKIGERVNLQMESLTETAFSIQSESIYNIPAFNSIVLEDSSAQWINGRLCVEMNWKYTEQSGRVISGDNFCRLEVDAAGNILKAI